MNLLWTIEINRRFMKIPTPIVILYAIIGNILIIYAATYLIQPILELRMVLIASDDLPIITTAFYMLAGALLAFIMMFAQGLLAIFVIDPKVSAYRGTVFIHLIVTFIIAGVASFLFLTFFQAIFVWLSSGVGILFSFSLVEDHLNKYVPPKDNSWQTGRTSGHFG